MLAYYDVEDKLALGNATKVDKLEDLTSKPMLQLE